MHRSENRLRAGWRLLIQLILFVVILVGVALFSTAMGRGAGTTSAASLIYLGSGLGLAWLMARYIDRRPFAEFGLRLNREWWVDLGFGVALGAIVMTGIFVSLRSAGWISATRTGVTDLGVPFYWAFMIKMLDLTAVGVNEELTFRGYQLKNLAEGLVGRRVSPRRAIALAFLISSGVFGVAHLANVLVDAAGPTGVSTLNLVAGGLLLGLPYLMTGQLAISIGLHIALNLFQGTVYGFPVSGSPQSTHLFSVQQTGPALWTGGAFGPEGGLIGSMWILIGCALAVMWIRQRRRRFGLYEPLARYIGVHQPTSGGPAQAIGGAPPTDRRVPTRES
ncbi:MAG TPA: CPBP family intramembrane glutamic endopeptidase [Vicinamibacterales bacterium]|nr:CPBP family intramembrane glutamic endopeptidase [Vicinamibacterales bacterium]